jgi:hypothetical protein
MVSNYRREENIMRSTLIITGVTVIAVLGIIALLRFTEVEINLPGGTKISAKKPSINITKPIKQLPPQSEKIKIDLTPLIEEPFIPSGASGWLIYASESDRFKGEISLTNLLPNHKYLLCLNGKPGQPGNTELGSIGDWYGQEGYYDFKMIITDNNGNLPLTELDPDLSRLPAGEYKVKFFVKDIENNYTCVLHNDFLYFKITGKSHQVTPTPFTIEFIYPKDGDEIHARGKAVTQIFCRGRVLGEVPEGARIKVDILTDKWYPQGIASIKRGGFWKVGIWLGGAEHEIKATLIDKSGTILATKSITVTRIW